MLSQGFLYEAKLSCGVTKEYVNFIIETRSQSIVTDKIQPETQMGDTLNLVIKALKSNSCPKNSSSLHPF